MCEHFRLNNAEFQIKNVPYVAEPQKGVDKVGFHFGETYQIRDVSRRRKTGTSGNFYQVGDPPPSPQFGNPMFVREKNYGLLCILGP